MSLWYNARIKIEDAIGRTNYETTLIIPIFAILMNKLIEFKNKLNLFRIFDYYELKFLFK